MTVWLTIGGIAVTTFLIRAFGPLAFGGRVLPPLLARTVPLLAPAIVTALIVVDSFAGGHRSLAVDPRAAGLVAAITALLLRAPVLLVVACAVGTTALVRLLT